MGADLIEVEVAYALPEQQLVLSIHGQAGMTVQEAVDRSGILQRCPELDWASADVGIYGKVVKRDQVLVNGDRVEIYRPLIADPKEMRKKRAAEGKVMRRGGGEAEEG